MSVYLIGTLDTKGNEVAFLRDRLSAAGIEVSVVDCGCVGEPPFQPDVSREEIFAAAGTSAEAVRAAGDRGAAITQAAEGVRRLAAKWQASGTLDGLLGIGGSAGTTIATSAMRAVPLGVPKLMVSTMASGQCRPYVGGKDIMMMNSVVDIAGLNRISRSVLSRAASAMAGMVAGTGSPATSEADVADRPLIAATMFGVTTPCVLRARERLEAAGYEVLVFHATGNGGESMEALIEDGLIAGVLDITTTELADELVGGILSAGPSRLTAAAGRGVPQVVSVGATDMVNFGPPESVPDRFRDRTLYHHNPTVTLMRTTVDECREIGADIGTKLSRSTGPVRVLLPEHGVSAIDASGQPFESQEARLALFESIESAAGNVPVKRLAHHVNDPEFADMAADALLELIASQQPETSS